MKEGLDIPTPITEKNKTQYLAELELLNGINDDQIRILSISSNHQMYSTVKTGIQLPVDYQESATPVTVVFFVFLTLLTNFFFMISEPILAINFVLLIVSLIVYFLYTVAYLHQNYNSFNSHFFSSLAVSIVISFIFWINNEIWIIEYYELVFGIMLISLPSVLVFLFKGMSGNDTMKKGMGAIYSIPACVAIYVFFAILLAPELNLTFGNF